MDISHVHVLRQIWVKLVDACQSEYLTLAQIGDGGEEVYVVSDSLGLAIRCPQHVGGVKVGLALLDAKEACLLIWV